MIRRIPKVHGVMVAMLAALTGCGSTDGSDTPANTETAARVEAKSVVENESALNLVARIDVDADTSVRFYEPAPGDLVSLELGRIGNPRVLSRADMADLVAFYQRTTGTAAPEALVQAIGRAQAAQAPMTTAQTEERASILASEAGMTTAFVQNPSTARSSATELVGHGIGQTSQALISDTWFWTNFCFESVSTSSSVHHVEWRRATGDQSQQLNDLMHNEASVEALDGNGITVTFKNRRFFTWSSGTNVSLAPGFYSNYAPQYANALATFDVKSEIGNATGDQYDACEYGQVR